MKLKGKANIQKVHSCFFDNFILITQQYFLDDFGLKNGQDSSSDCDSVDFQRVITKFKQFINDNMR